MQKTPLARYSMVCVNEYVCMCVEALNIRRNIHTAHTSTLHCRKPSPNRTISAIIAESGTIMAMGRNILLRLSGNSVLPAYPESANTHSACM